MNDIRFLMSQFAQLDGASLGRGPKHPGSTTRHITQMNAETDEFYQQCQGALFDEEFREFLHYSGGGLIKREELLLHIWGPDTELANDLVWEDVLFDWNYYCTFCCIRSNDQGRIDYGFAKYQAGVFQATRLSQNKNKVIKYCDSFSEWLKWVVTDINQILNR